jgi:ribosome-associated translation inhibitor RaiA
VELIMRIDIHTPNFELTEALRGHIERRLYFALGARHDRVRGIRVRLSDINGPRGGNDKFCQLSVVLPGQATVVIEDTQSNLYVAIDRAADRASRTVSRKLPRFSGNKRNRLPEGQYALDGMAHTYFLT